MRDGGDFIECGPVLCLMSQPSAALTGVDEQLWPALLFDDVRPPAAAARATGAGLLAPGVEYDAGPHNQPFWRLGTVEHGCAGPRFDEPVADLRYFGHLLQPRCSGGRLGPPVKLV